MTLSKLTVICVLVLVCINYVDAQFKDGVVATTISTSKVKEASGLGSSKKHTTRLWVINDSGDYPRIYAFSTVSGSRRAMLTLAGAENKDWEDLAVGKGPDGSDYIYVVDTGYASNTIVTLYRVKEPDTLFTGTVTPDVMKAKWPHTSDCEALMVDEQGTVYLVKTVSAGRKPRVYEVPSSGWNSGIEETLLNPRDMPVLSTSNTAPRAADISRDGTEVIMSDHGRNYYWKLSPGENIVDVITSRAPIIVPQVNEPLREAIAWSYDSDGYYTLSEESYQPLYYFERDATLPTTTTTTTPPPPPITTVTSGEAQFLDGIVATTISTSKVTEASGLGSSKKHTTRLWVINDSGDEPRIYAFSTVSGSRRAMLTLDGAENRDWEDLAVGKGPDGSDYIYVVDTGYAANTIVTLYRVKEPDTLFTGTVTPDVMKAKWPHSSDCEALMVDEQGTVYLIKTVSAGSKPRVYEVPSSGWNSGNEETLLNPRDMPVLSTSNTAPRSADISRDGSEVLMSDHGKNYYWKISPGENVVDVITSRAPKIVPQVDETLRESIAWSYNADGYYTLSEGNYQPLHYFEKGTPEPSLTCPPATSPPLSGDRLVFTALGDWGNPGTEQSGIASKIGEWSQNNNAAFVLALGDNFYENGISSVTDSDIDGTWRNIFTNPALLTKWYVIAGNHDHRYDRAHYQVDLSAIDSRWHFPSLYYSFYRMIGTTQKVHFIMLDTQTGRDGNDAVQLAWFKQELEQSLGDWIIVVGHHPVFSRGSHGRFSSTRGMFEHFKPLMDQHKVALYICGHDHGLEHIWEPSSRKVDYVVSGSGSKIRSPDPTALNDLRANGAESCFYEQQYGFTGLAIQGDFITVTYIDKFGAKVHEFVKENPRKP